MKEVMKMKAMKGMTLFLVSAVFLLSFTGCKDEGGTPTEPGKNEVWMQHTAFVPATLTVAKGATITWTNKDNMDHTTTSNDGLWDSGVMSGGGTFSHTFSNTGTFNYHCTIHSSVMTGKIIVVEATQGY